MNCIRVFVAGTEGKLVTTTDAIKIIMKKILGLI